MSTPPEVLFHRLHHELTTVRIALDVGNIEAARQHLFAIEGLVNILEETR